MPDLFQRCTICTKQFAVQFSYQMEERVVVADGVNRTAFHFFCSQNCLRASQEGCVACDGCGTAFKVTHAAHVAFVSGKRRYSCGESCRKQLLLEQHGHRLGELDHAQAHATKAPHERQSDLQQPQLVDFYRAPRRAGRSTPDPNEPTEAASNGSLERKARVIAVFNHKGGTGKTTTAVTLAAGLASRGKKTLLVDTDAQGNVSVSLGLKSKRSLYHVIVMGLQLSEVTRRARANLDVLPSNETLAAAELYLAGRKNRDRVLSDRLASTQEDYDFVVVDCSPSLSLLNQNALVFADSVLCPVACDYLSLVGVRQVLKTIKNVNRLLKHPVQLWGVLPTLYDTRARICREALETLREHFGPRCLNPVRSAIRVKEAPSQGMTLFEYAAGSSAANDYQQVVDRLINEGNSSAEYAATA